MRRTATPWPLQLAAAALLALPLAVTAQAPTYRIAIPVATSTAQAQQAPEAQAMVGRLMMDLPPVEARTPAELDTAFASFVSQRVDALLTLSDPMTFAHGRRVAEMAVQHRLPVVSPYRETAGAGGLAAYGPNVLAMLRRAGELADRILLGTRPADLAVEQPTRFELIVNLKTARGLGQTVPQALLLRADEVLQ